MHSLAFRENSDFFGIRIDFGCWAKDTIFITSLKWFKLHFHNMYMMAVESYFMTFYHFVGMPEFLNIGHLRCFRCMRFKHILVEHIPTTDHIPITLHSKSLS